MTREEKLRAEYEDKLNQLRKEQAECDHAWSETVYDPEFKKVPITKTHFQGSDCWPEIVGHRDEKIDRWSRTCSKCGKVEYATERVPVKYEPKFN